MRRRSAAALVGAALWFAVPGVAHADPAGPTDYRTEIAAISPTSDVISVSVEGGDSFVRIEVDPGHDVLIFGYDGEPYLRIGTDGTVEQNRRSYATYYNEDRYGITDIPDIVDNEAEPDWERVGDGGSWAWHDHRAHWMGTEPPIGLDPGEALPVQTIPISVDGRDVSIDVRIRLVAPPSRIPVVFGLLFGLTLALLAVRLGPASTATALVLVAAGAVTVGLGQYLSLPAETGRMATWWLLPMITLVGVAVAIATYGRSRFLLMALIALGAAQLAVWAFARRAVLSRPVLPTDLPAGFDRFVTASALAVGVVTLLGALRWLFASPTDPA